MLSVFESALLDRHLRGCASCSAFAVSAEAQAALLRAAPLEVLERRVVIPASPVRRIGRAAAGVLSASVAAAAAVAVFMFSGAGSTGNGPSLAAARSGAPVMVTFAASPSPASATVEVPRLRVQPASIADGPVHGYFNEPVA